MHGFGHALMQKGPRPLVVSLNAVTEPSCMMYYLQGNEYIDAMGGIPVAHLDHGRSVLLAQVAYNHLRSLAPISLSLLSEPTRRSRRGDR